MISKEELKKRCEALKVGNGALIRKFLDEIAEDGLTSIGAKKGQLTKVNLTAREVIEKKLKEIDERRNLKNKNEGPNGRPLDPWGQELPF